MSFSLKVNIYRRVRKI